ncbi:hypothetical protein JOM56_011709 [Amanita muscaria]
MSSSRNFIHSFKDDEQLEEASFGSMKIAVQASCLPLASILASASFVWSEEQASTIVRKHRLSSIDELDRSYHNGLFVLGKSAMPDRQSKICCPKIKFGAVQVLLPYIRKNLLA